MRDKWGPTDTSIGYREQCSCQELHRRRFTSRCYSLLARHRSGLLLQQDKATPFRLYTALICSWGLPTPGFVSGGTPIDVDRYMSVRQSSAEFAAVGHRVGLGKGTPTHALDTMSDSIWA